MIIKNPPAFPRPEAWASDSEIGTRPAQEGMTLRDYFAAKAMQGFISRGGNYDAEFDADRAYAYADAMLKARDA
jgi:hypothetical protein